MPKNPKVAGQVVGADGERVFLVGETLADVLDLANWELVVDARPTRTPDEEAARLAKPNAERSSELEAWERDMKANPPKRIA